MKLIFRKTAILMLALLLAASVHTTAFASENGINFGAWIESTEEVLTVTVDGDNAEAFEQLQKSNKYFHFTTDCTFPEAYAVHEGGLVDAQLEAGKITFPVHDSGDYQIINGAGPVIARSDSEITITVSQQNDRYLDFISVPCTWNEVRVTLAESAVQATVADGMVTVPVDGDGVYTITAGNDVHTHTYSPIVTAPTCTKQGYTTYTCQCGDSYMDDYVDPLGHNFDNSKVCSRCGMIGGICGEDLTWTLDIDGTLTISGTGEILEVNSVANASPWYAYRSDVKTAVIEEGVENISRYAFYECRNLTEVSLPESLKTIERNAFSCCSSLREITLPNSLQTIETYAFEYCQNLRSVTIPASVVTIEEIPFYGCFELKEIKVEDGNTSYCSVDGVLFDKGMQTLIQYPGGLEGTYTIPDTVTAFGKSLSYAVNLTELLIPESIDVIPGHAFYYCRRLSRVEFQGQISSVGIYAFSSSDSLAEVYFTGNAPVFEGTRIFDENTATNVYYPTNNATWTTDVMQNYGGTITWVPYGSVEKRLVLDSAELGGYTSVWIDGVEMAIQQDGASCYVDLPDSNAHVMTAYTYHSGTAEDGVAVHGQYPVSMKVWALSNRDGIYTVERIEELDDILLYSGMSIRIKGKLGIRMITSVDAENKGALTGDGLAGYTLQEYGTVIALNSKLDDDKPLVLGKSYVASNYAYRRGVADPVFANDKGRVQYTNVLVNFTLEQCKEDIAMRPYMILQDAEGNEITIYGGIVCRSIGYIALQNRGEIPAGTEAGDYIRNIIHAVYGNAYDEAVS